MWIYRAYVSNDGDSFGSLYQKYFLKIDNYIVYRNSLSEKGIVCLLDIFETEDELDG